MGDKQIEEKIILDLSKAEDLEKYTIINNHIKEENNKYYTPSIEEFYIGFLYEYKDYKNDWIKDDYCLRQDYEGFDNTSPFYWSEDNLINNIRVKYLDKEDIEKELKDKLDFTEIGYEEDNYYEFSFNQGGIEFSGLLTNSDRIFSIYEDKECSFRGEIKNKSELIKPLKQLGING